MQVALSGMDIFWIFKFLINEKKHCSSILQKKYDHLESELDIIVSQKIDPYLFGIIVNHFLVLWIDVYTLKCSMLRNNLFQDDECFNILYKLVFQIFIRQEFVHQLNLQQLHRFPGYNYLEVGLFYFYSQQSIQHLFSRNFQLIMQHAQMVPVLIFFTFVSVQKQSSQSQQIM